MKNLGGDFAQRISTWAGAWVSWAWWILGRVLVTAWQLLQSSMGDERLAAAARGKWPNVNSSFWW